MLSRSGYLHGVVREQRRIINNLTNQLLDNLAGWGENGQTDTGIPDDRDSLVARIEALEAELQEVRNA